MMMLNLKINDKYYILVISLFPFFFFSWCCFNKSFIIQSNLKKNLSLSLLKSWNNNCDAIIYIYRNNKTIQKKTVCFLVQKKIKYIQIKLQLFSYIYIYLHIKNNNNNNNKLNIFVFYIFLSYFLKCFCG